MPPTKPSAAEALARLRQGSASSTRPTAAQALAALRAKQNAPAPTPTTGADLSVAENFRQDALRVGKRLDEKMAGANEAPTFAEGALRATGAVAGAIGGSVAAGAEALGRALLPKSAEKAVESGVAKFGELAEPVVKPVMEAYEENVPERVRKDIGAAVDIASVLPVGLAPRAARVGLEGAGSLATAGKAAIKDIATPSPLGVAEVATGKAVAKTADRINEIVNVESIKSVRREASRAAGRDIDIGKILAEKRVVPEVADGKFQAAGAIDAISDDISKLSTTLEDGLKTLPNASKIDDLKSAVKREALADKDLFNRGASQAAEREAIQQLDDYARQIALRDKLGVEMADAIGVYDQQLFKKGQYFESGAFKNSQSKSDAAAVLARVFRKNIEEAAGSDAVKLVNRRIGELEETVRVLRALDGSAVKGGRLGGLGGRVIGAVVGSQAAGPLSGIVGAILGGSVTRALQQAAVAGPIRRVLLARSAKAPSTELAKALRYLEDLGPLADEGIARTVAEAAQEAGVTNLLMLPAKAGPSRNPLDVVSVTPAGKASKVAQEAADVAAVETGAAKVPQAATTAANMAPEQSAPASLVAEARKYRTAEEFVKAQGKPVYHGSTRADSIKREGFKKIQEDNKNMASAFGEGTYFATKKREAYATKPEHLVEAYLPKDVKLKKVSDSDAYRIDTQKLVREGYDGVELVTGNGSNLTIFDPSVIKTKQQLLDIYRAANKADSLAPVRKIAEASDEATMQVLTEMELSAPGYRNFYSYGKDRKVTGVPSTFPTWVPTELRSSKLFDEVMQAVNDGRRPTKKKASQLYDLVLKKIEERRARVLQAPDPDAINVDDIAFSRPESSLPAREGPKANLIGKNARIFRSDIAKSGPDANAKNIILADIKLKPKYSELADERKFEGRKNEIYLSTLRANPGKNMNQLTKEGNASALEWDRLQSQQLSGVSMRDVIDYPELFEAYPEAKNIRVRILGNSWSDGRTKGSFGVSPNGNPKITVYANETKDALETLKHEIQHFIQAKEGWPRGGSPDEIYGPSAQYMMFSKLRDNLFERANRGALEEASIRDLMRINQLVENAGNGKAASISDMFDMFGGQEGVDRFANRLYRDLYGEAEARANGIPEGGTYVIRKPDGRMYRR